MPTHPTGSLGLVRRRRLAFVAAGILAAAQWCLQLVLTHADPLAVAGVGGQVTALAAVFWCAAGLTTVGGGGECRRLAGYVASLVVVFGTDMVFGVIEWIWLPPCQVGAGVGAGAGSLVVRLIEAALGLCLAAIFLPAAAPGPRGDRISRVPAGWFVAAGACLVHALAGAASESFALPDPWCIAITGAGAAPSYKFLLDLMAGPQEEIVFTGVALLLLAGCGWRPQCAAIAASAMARGSLHLYYADHRTVWAWMLWAAVWSGGGLLLAFMAARIADQVNIGQRFFVIIYTAGIVVAHSLGDITHLRLIAPFFVFGIAAVVVGIELWWQTLRQRSPAIRRALRRRSVPTRTAVHDGLGELSEREAPGD
ncbi:hypothetical protein A5658_03290 [Mycobacterium sp. 1245111.1]|uniref:hypothetical protein n=1 Tax=Mycobacterium sp. 1245111.1 TaxID=1834073 RepID=UPI0007FCFE60|nr:hypothetical protein [Mycobacterium sp. 1245111.1]OBK38557.1 hypothetical protein A5658_03290 [Mycobacterium sp. 1245111.1]